MPETLDIKERSVIELSGVLESLTLLHAPNLDEVDPTDPPVSLSGDFCRYAQALIQGVLVWAWRERMTMNEFDEHYRYGTTGGRWSTPFMLDAYHRLIEAGERYGLTERDDNDPLLQRPKANARLPRLSPYTTPDYRHFASVAWHLASTQGGGTGGRFTDVRVWGNEGATSFIESRQVPWMDLDEALVWRWMRHTFPLGPRGDEGSIPGRSHVLRGGVRAGGTYGLKGLALLVEQIEVAMTEGERAMTQDEAGELALAAEAVVQQVERACLPVSTTERVCAPADWLIPLTFASITGGEGRLSFANPLPDWPGDLATLTAGEAYRAFQALSLHADFRAWAATNGVELPDFEVEIGAGPVVRGGNTRHPTRTVTEREPRVRTPVVTERRQAPLQPGAQQAGGGLLLGLAALGLGLGYLYKEGKL